MGDTPAKNRVSEVAHSDAVLAKKDVATIFGAYDIRAEVGTLLNGPLARRLGEVLGYEARRTGSRAVVVGRDGRLSSPDLSELLVHGIRSVGCDVVNVGQVPSPVVYFATHALKTGAGVMVTASHNPARYNGFKVVLGGISMPGRAIWNLFEHAPQGDAGGREGGLQWFDVIPAYIEKICAGVSLARPLRIVVDGGDGVAGPLAVQVLQSLGCTVLPLFCEVDGRFPHHDPDPSDPANLEALSACVRENRADLGLAMDGDGDRLGVVDGNGHVIWPDRIFMLFARDVLARAPGSPIIFDVKCSQLLERDIERHGGRPLMWKSGHALLKAKLRETGAPLAGEFSGHFFFADRWYGFDDGIYAAARLLELLARSELSPAQQFAALPNATSTPELRVPLDAAEPAQVMSDIISHFPAHPGRVTLMDGLRIDFDDGWGLVRASNTLPCLVLRFEAESDARLREIAALFKAALAIALPRSLLPF